MAFLKAPWVIVMRIGKPLVLGEEDGYQPQKSQMQVLALLLLTA